MIFKDRQEAGQKLIPRLENFKDDKTVVILALPRGGVVTAYEISKALNLALDIVVPRKIGAPGHEEFAIGAITKTGEGIFNQDTIESYHISQKYIDQTVAKEKKEAERRLKVYRGDKPAIGLKDKTVIIVDDGIATGATMKAAIKSIKAKKPSKIIVAVPVSAQDSAVEIEGMVDELITLDRPEFFGAVGAFYENFGQTTDQEVVKIMKQT